MGKIYSSYGDTCNVCQMRLANDYKECLKCFTEDMIAVESFACPKCLNPRAENNRAYLHCYNCNELLNKNEYWLDGILSCSYKYTKDSDFGFALHAYKGSRMPKREWMAFPLMALAFNFLENHLNCIKAEYGKVDAIVPIPGSAEQLLIPDVNRILPIANLLIDNRITGRQAENTVSRVFDPNRFSVKSGRMPERAILFDDVHTTGVTSHSASYALKQNGVNSVVLFTLSTILLNKSIRYIEGVGRSFRIDKCFICDA